MPVLLQIGLFRSLFTHTGPLSTIDIGSIRRDRFWPGGRSVSVRWASLGRLHREMKILYKPFAIIAGIVGARLGRSVFKRVWGRIDTGEPPAPTAADANLPKVVGAAALEAATIAGVAAAVDRAGARTFHYLTGIWPGKTTKNAEES
jgi:hypothetical protein